jgi:hypothetical protein
MAGQAGMSLQVGLSEFFEIVEENKVPFKKTG